MTIDDEYCPTELSETDILQAMHSIPGYIDITPADFRAVYLAAHRSALRRLRESVRARDIMTRSVVTVSPTVPLAELADLLNRHNISGAPVVDKNGVILGVVSEKDFFRMMGVASGDTFMKIVARCFGGRGCPAISARNKRAADLMSAPAVTVEESASVHEISTLMSSKGINLLPVIDASGHLKGIVTRSAVVSAYCSID